MPTNKKIIVDAKQDEKGNISDVLFKGNQTFTPMETAWGMTKRGEVDAVAIELENGTKYIRTLPDDKIKNNLDEMAKKKK